MVSGMLLSDIGSLFNRSTKKNRSQRIDRTERNPMVVGAGVGGFCEKGRDFDSVVFWVLAQSWF